MAGGVNAFALSMALAALAAQEAPETYRAQGGNPAWTLEIGERRIRFEQSGAPAMTAERGATSEDEGSRRYEADGIAVDALPGGCTDRASGRRYADAVFVTIGQRQLGGCGGAELAADTLENTSWHLLEIGGEPVPLTGDLLRDDIYAIDFGPDRIVGYGGCNRIGAAYTRTGDMIAFGPFGSTRRLCPEPVMRRERRLLEILGAPTQISLGDPNTLLLTGDSGSIKLRRTVTD